jgi:hypothetical protein
LLGQARKIIGGITIFWATPRAMALLALGPAPPLDEKILAISRGNLQRIESCEADVVYNIYYV